MLCQIINECMFISMYANENNVLICNILHVYSENSLDASVFFTKYEDVLKHFTAS